MQGGSNNSKSLGYILHIALVFSNAYRRVHNRFMTVTCPFCFESIEVTLFVEEGEKQEFITDCEVCCNPILVKARWDNSIDDFEVTLESTD